MEDENLVYSLLERFNTFRRYTDEEIKDAKEICKNHYKLNLLAKRYLKTNSTHTLTTMLKIYWELMGGKAFQDEIWKRTLKEVHGKEWKE